MFLLFEFLTAIFEPILLFIGAIISFFLGNAVLHSINRFLYAFNTPCIEVVTLILAIVSPLGYIFGARHKKFLTERRAEHNFIIFLLSFLFGAVVTFLPIGFNYMVESERFFCPAQISLFDKIAQSISTATLTAVIAFLSVDLGVIYANTVGAHLRKINKRKKN